MPVVAPGPCETLPGLLPGARVRLRGSRFPGKIVRTGHRYGPGSGHDQAAVRFIRIHPGDPAAAHPLKRRTRISSSECWYYLTELEFAP